MRLLSLRNLTAMLCAVLLMLWLFRVFYQSTGTAPLSGHGVHMQNGDDDPRVPRRQPPRSSRDPTVRAPVRKRSDLQAERVEKVAQVEDSAQKAKVA